jgi:hypothetical protein
MPQSVPDFRRSKDLKPDFCPGCPACGARSEYVDGLLVTWGLAAVWRCLREGCGEIFETYTSRKELQEGAIGEPA